MPRKKAENVQTTAEKTQYKNNYNSLHYETFRVNSPKDEHLIALIDAAVEAGCDKSRQSYILNSIRAALRRDGILPAEEE